MSKTKEKTERETLRKPLRLWPGVVAAVLLWLSRFGVKTIIPGFEGFSYGLMGALILVLLILLWWAFFSRAPYIERFGGLGLIIGALWATWILKHESMGPLWLVGYAVPLSFLAFVGWAVLSRRLAIGLRRVTMVATILISCGLWLLVRTSGVDGDHVAKFSWRWAKSPEERLMIHTGDGALPSPDELAAGQIEIPWPGFRGPNRDGIVHDVQIDTDWSTTPPEEIWRQPVGPGWSSFAVRGDLLFTQEQRGDDETVTCYRATTGEPVWVHRDGVRFFESNAGAGPRGTPTIHGDRVYTLGATGILNALYAMTGEVAWSRDSATDTETEIPVWGFAGSPLVVDDVVVTALASSLIAHDITTGHPRWVHTVGSNAYSSPQLMTLAGVQHVVFLNERGAQGFTPSQGTQLWQHSWPGAPIVQPAWVGQGRILITVSQSSGVRCVNVTHQENAWTVQEMWTSIQLRPYFNDLVVHRGHVYGFNNRILTCIDLDVGQRQWRGGRYGNGQLILLADQDTLLVLSEKGELALVRAAPERFEELARFQAIRGKTWNHPVVVDDLLFVRNAQEMAAFRLSLKRGPETISGPEPIPGPSQQP